MTDRRTVDDLSIEEIEQILVMKRRELRCERLQRLARIGRTVDDPPPPEDEAASVITETPVKRSQKTTSRFWSLEYEPTENTEPGRSSSGAGGRKSRSPSTWRDRVLLGLEVAALIGLVAIAAGSFTNLKTLNEEVAQAREVQPTPTATPMIQASILPGGSAPPPISDDVPEAYRNLVRPMPSMQVPTPSPQQPTRVVIPAIGVDAVVVRGDSWEDLKKGAGHHIGSVNPGERGNMIISAHNDVFGEIFRRLEDLNLGDKVTVYTRSQSFEYQIKAKRVVEPSDVSVMGSASRPVLTLITCYPYLIDTHRLIAIAELQR